MTSPRLLAPSRHGCNGAVPSCLLQRYENAGRGGGGVSAVFHVRRKKCAFLAKLVSRPNQRTVTSQARLQVSICFSAHPPPSFCRPPSPRRPQILEGEPGAEDDGGDAGVPKKRRNKKNRYGMPKQRSGRRFRAERMNIFGMRTTTEFSIDEVRGKVCRTARLAKLQLLEWLWDS